jgi:peptidoglycan/LPS O-acetylase OafA/YrhL
MEYRSPSLSEFVQLRRGLPTLAAVLLVAAIFLPMWVINVQAIQYPNEVLTLKLYAYPHIAGDYGEMAALNHYIGFYYPDPVFWTPNFEVNEAAVNVPEWSFGVFAFLAVAAAGVFVAIAPSTSKLKLGLKSQLVGTVLVFTVVVADIQYRLYQAGHTLDPDAPVVGVDPFTPPLWGRYEVANITSYSRFGAGAYLTIVAIGLLVVAFYYRDSEATFGELPARIRRRVEGLRPGAGTDDEASEGSTPVTEMP